jgi:hypothetical protein
VLESEHVPTTSTTVMDGPSPTPTTTNQDQGEATVEGGGVGGAAPSINARTSSASTSESSSFKDHQRHECTYYTVESLEQFSFCSFCFCFHI